MFTCRCEETREGALWVTPLVDRLDAGAAPDLRDTVGAMVRGRRLAVLSLGRVRAIDASGLAALVAILKAMPPGAELRLADVQPSVRAALAATRLDEVFPMVEAASAASPALRPAPPSGRPRSRRTSPGTRTAGRETPSRGPRRASSPSRRSRRSRSRSAPGTSRGAGPPP
jgi:anti-sigma B factor antagonist